MIFQSDAVLLMTCSIREGAEQKIWRRVEQLKATRKQRQRKYLGGLKIGILGIVDIFRSLCLIKSKLIIVIFN